MGVTTVQWLGIGLFAMAAVMAASEAVKIVHRIREDERRRAALRSNTDAVEAYSRMVSHLHDRQSELNQRIWRIEKRFIDLEELKVGEKEAPTA